MIGMEGIEYHPGQRKKSGGFKLWMLLVIFVVVVVYFLSDEQIPKKLNTGLIVVKESEPDVVKIVSIPVNIETTTSNPRSEEPKMLESLDELNEFYKKQQ
ncbi:hypothetical protein [uncultured Gammaproteobacteria bacterium]|jgi:hypothetical protein|uniref:hypothetical protein n=1 Tax=thiotrophic endosymbiont of Bathymodiolus puteoserpentis (Logatchev) TaxID=343240 RepID=UPI0010BAC20D|nr:hypothetical protein [thiotrophic endosymbiont of Bathymodiolus puteoserpentis (Logatchev)]CAC9491924.1 hypothetical protein [uncultured Gammaproteobacteria bacterium]CAC9502554.1 hypothetical protein [uncultured Gammaproteobacteria bacterium]CAC9643823.1 hypothetical protein [uncultured Gammaproteobacteria bacterium]CAC9982512.1 hypothetical protein [uncultured Gammaproteobacteria bacterium]SSC10308.1 hypothetical protein BPUTEOSOX_80 [thiotrophic endosymbiont of Bathymodiolus puteoserpent